MAPPGPAMQGRHRDRPALSEAAFVHIHTEVAMADLTIDPGRAGQANAIIRLSREDFTDFPARDVRLALDPPAPGGTTIEHAAVRVPDGTWQIAKFNIPKPGIWIARVIIGTNATAPPIVLDGPIVITQCSNEC